LPLKGNVNIKKATLKNVAFFFGSLLELLF
jgi:hypothetical protein